MARYNSFVDSGTDDDFGKPKPLYKIAKPPFYAAWATPVVHDTRAGLRINASCQVMDMSGQVIPGLYCGGESGGWFQPAWPRPSRVPGIYRWQARHGGTCEDLTSRKTVSPKSVMSTPATSEVLQTNEWPDPGLPIALTR